MPFRGGYSKHGTSGNERATANDVRKERRLP
jgi:hypothetical protein